MLFYPATPSKVAVNIIDNNYKSLALVAKQINICKMLYVRSWCILYLLIIINNRESSKCNLPVDRLRLHNNHALPRV